MDNVAVIFLWLFCLVLGFYAITLERKFKRLEERFDYSLVLTHSQWETYKAEKNVDNFDEAVEDSNFGSP